MSNEDQTPMSMDQWLDRLAAEIEPVAGVSGAEAVRQAREDLP